MGLRISLWVNLQWTECGPWAHDAACNKIANSQIPRRTMNQPLTIRQRIRYFLDELIGRGSAGLIGLLTLMAAVLILVVSVAMTLVGAAPADGAPVPFVEALWLSMVRTLDAGTFGGDQGWAFRGLMFVDTLGGVFIVALLIGVLSNAIEERLRELRKGRSLVAESGHTLILGWSAKVITVVAQLIMANESQRSAHIVIVADRDKVEMEDEIRARIPNWRTTHVICRRGSPIDPIDIAIGRPFSAKSIIVLAGSDGDPDAEVIKSILALTLEKRRIGGSPLNIVAEIKEPQNLHVAQIVGRKDAEFVLTSDLIARIIAQTCRQSGLATIYVHLLDYSGSEVYFTSQPALIGMTFGAAQFAYDTSVVIGLRRSSGEIVLNPHVETLIAAGDQAIVIAIDDSQIPLDGLPQPSLQLDAIRNETSREPKVEHSLILGWNARGLRLIQELDAYVGPGSTAHVVTVHPPDEAALHHLESNLENLAVTVETGNINSRALLESVQLDGFQHVILLAEIFDTVQRADARVLMTLLHLRDMIERDGQTFSLTTEILDIGNRELAEVTRADDFIVSDQLTSLMMAQLSENREVGVVFGELFGSEGNEIYLRPATDYVESNRNLTFYALVASAQRKGEIAIGYRIAAQKGDAHKEYGIVINPRKSHTFTLGSDDKVIVIAHGIAGANRQRNAA